MEIKEFNKNYFLHFKIEEEEKLEFELETINRNTLQTAGVYKKLKSEASLDWLQEKIGEEILEGRHPESFINSFYENTKRKLINTLLIKNKIKGLNPLDTKENVDFLFQ